MPVRILLFFGHQSSEMGQGLTKKLKPTPENAGREGRQKVLKVPLHVLGAGRLLLILSVGIYRKAIITQGWLRVKVKLLQILHADAAASAGYFRKTSAVDSRSPGYRAMYSARSSSRLA
jgi:hypothetical protein